MLIKVFQTSNRETLEIVYKEFQANNDVAYTQSHVNILHGTKPVSLFTLVVYYKEPATAKLKGEAKEEKTTPTENQKLCNKCGKVIPKSWKRHDECGWKE